MALEGCLGPQRHMSEGTALKGWLITAAAIHRQTTNSHLIGVISMIYVWYLQLLQNSQIMK